MANTTVTKGFIKDWAGNSLLPITRGELVLDAKGRVALESEQFLAKNGHPGLVTAAERELIASLGGLNGSGGDSGSITDIYTKLGYINNGLQINDRTLNFYNPISGALTPINIKTSTTTGLTATVANNQVVELGLTEIHTGNKAITQFVKEITVDKYGRVTGISGTDISGDDLPVELVSKTLINNILQGCTTNVEDIPDNALAIVNKAYVDKKFADMTNVSTGALKFGGGLSDATIAEAKLSDGSAINTYYKVTKAFNVKVDDLYDKAGITSTDNIEVKVGDTLIISIEPVSNKTKFVYVPSGDEITTISVMSDGYSGAFPATLGNVILKFNNVFKIESSGKTASINLQPAGETQGGYLTKEDWLRFNSYASHLSTTYTGEFSSGEGVYTIGNINIGGVDHFIYGKNNISTFSLENRTGNDTGYNPILKFTETGEIATEITLQGSKGLTIKKTGHTVEFSNTYEVVEQEIPQTGENIKYITLQDGYKFGVQLGSVNNEGVIQDGLADFRDMLSFVSMTLRFTAIDYSLLGSASTTQYRYGNDMMLEAIGGTRADGSASWDVLTI